jgi:hypothetical protein
VTKVSITVFTRLSAKFLKMFSATNVALILGRRLFEGSTFYEIFYCKRQQETLATKYNIKTLKCKRKNFQGLLKIAT